MESTELPFVGHAYGLTVLDRRLVRRIWRLDTVQGVFACKPALPPAKSSFLRAVEAHLAGRGFTRFPRLLSTLSGQAELRLTAGRGYVVRPWLPGTNPCLDTEHPTDLRLTMEAMAELHLAGAGFRWPYACRGYHGSWLRLIAERVEQIRAFCVMGGGPFPLLYRRGTPIAAEEANTAARLLEASGYEALSGATAGGGRICHGDMAANNALISGGAAYLLDLERAELDVLPSDLARLSRRILTQQGWESGLFESLLAAYQRIRSLSAAELRTTIALLHWPQVFWRLGHQYFAERLGRPQDYFLRRLERWLEETERRRAFLRYCIQNIW